MLLHSADPVFWHMKSVQYPLTYLCMVNIHIRYIHVSEYKLPNNHRGVTDAPGGHAAIHRDLNRMKK